MNTKVIFLDIGGVLLDVSFKNVFKKLEIDNSDIQEKLQSDFSKWSVYHAYEKGDVDCSQYFKELSLFLESYTPNAKLGSNDLKEIWNDIIIEELPGAETIFDEFKNDFKICSLSNTNKCHRDFEFHKYPSLQRFDKDFLSYELGLIKPQSEIYIEVCRQMNISPNEGLFIDDKPENVEAARAVGMKAFQSLNSTEKTIQIIKNNAARNSQ